MEATSPKKINDHLDQANGDDIEVIVNSGGGDVYSGSEIYTSLKDYKGTVTVKIVGIAASAASVISMAGDNVLISPTAQMMIHNASNISMGDHNNHQSSAEFLRNWDKSITNAYMLKSGMGQEELLALMDKETWFTAQQAKEKGLVDEIMFEDQNQPMLVASLGNTQMIPQQVIDKIRNKLNKDNPSLEDLKNLFKDGLFNQTGPQNKKGEEKPMNLEELKNKHPELYEQIKNEGYQEGVKAENARIKSVEDNALPGFEELVNKAKYKEPINGDQLAGQIIRAQKEQGANYLNNRNKDAEELNNVEGSEAPEGQSEDQEIKDNANIMAKFVNKNRGGVQ